MLTTDQDEDVDVGTDPSAVAVEESHDVEEVSATDTEIAPEQDTTAEATPTRRSSYIFP